MSSTSSFPSIPTIGLSFPSTPLTEAALAFARQHMSPSGAYHVLRSAYFAVILSSKIPTLVAQPPDMEVVMISTLLHDMGFVTSKALLSTDKRFEVDGANIARDFLVDARTKMAAASSKLDDKHTLQLVWDAIALHTSPSISQHKEPEVMLTTMGILVDLFGPSFGGGLVSVDEFKAVLVAFPHLGFKDEIVQAMCGLCREKRDTTFDNFVGLFGCEYGIDGKVTGRDEYRREWEEKKVLKQIVAGLEETAQYS